jgi:hypothetical protein
MSGFSTRREPELAREDPPPGEQAHIDSLIRRLRAKMERDYAAGRMLRDAHPKMHGCVRAEFSINADLPQDLAIGVFQRERTYQAWMRFSNSSGSVAPDSKGDIRGVAIKLMSVEGTKLLPDETDGTTHDFILISDDRFVTRDVAEFDRLVGALTGGPLKMLWFFVCNPRAARNLLTGLKRFSNPLTIRYFSCVPYLLGSRAVKYSLTPRNAHDEAPPANPSEDYLKEAMARQLASSAAVFDFAIQFQMDPKAMPIEDPGVRWEEAVSPFHKVGTITIPAQVFDTPARQEFGDNLSFNPWRSLPEHRPLGGISRARLQVYQALSSFRHERNQSPRAEPVETESV